MKNDQTDSQYLISLARWREKANKEMENMEETIKRRVLENAHRNKKKEGFFSKILKFFKLRS